MQREFTENWSHFCQCASEPMIKMTELNINTLNNIMKSAGSLEELQSKKPEDLMSAQMKLANAAYLEASKYTQKAMEIGINAMSDASKIWADSFTKATSKAADFTKSANPANKNRE